jgi:hypothetical protein
MIIFGGNERKRMISVVLSWRALSVALEEIMRILHSAFCILMDIEKC